MNVCIWALKMCAVPNDIQFLLWSSALVLLFQLNSVDLL